MPERIDSLNPVRDLVKEQMYPTTMHSTRDLATIRAPRDRSLTFGRAMTRALIEHFAPVLQATAAQIGEAYAASLAAGTGTS